MKTKIPTTKNVKGKTGRSAGLILDTRYWIRDTNRGFTLIETLVAVIIFTFSIVGIIVITGQGISDANIAKNRLVASYLSQEGIEIIRSVRDSNSFDTSGNGWDNFNLATAPCAGVDGCTVDYSTVVSSAPNPIGPCPSGGCQIAYNTGTGYYEVDLSGVPHLFQRIVHLSMIGTDEVQVTSTVTWTQGTLERHVTVVENIFNWYNATP